MPRRGHYRAPLVPVVPAVGILFNFALATSLDLITWVYFLIFSVIGLVVYFSYSIRHSKLEVENVTGGQFETSIITENPFVTDINSTV